METQQVEENEQQVEILKAVKGFNPELIKNCYAVGFWVWAEFKQKLSQEELSFLKGIGFRWNPVRKVWQNACGFKTRSSKGDPRLKYQVIKFEQN